MICCFIYLCNGDLLEGNTEAVVVVVSICDHFQLNPCENILLHLSFTRSNTTDPWSWPVRLVPRAGAGLLLTRSPSNAAGRAAGIQLLKRRMKNTRIRIEIIARMWEREHSSEVIVQLPELNHRELLLFPLVSVCWLFPLVLLVCQQDYTKTTEQISMNLGLSMCLGPEIEPINFLVKEGSRNFSLAFFNIARFFFDIFINFWENWMDLDDKNLAYLAGW